MKYLSLQQVIERFVHWVRSEKPKGWRIEKDGQSISSSNFNAKMNIDDKQKALADQSQFSGEKIIADALDDALARHYGRFNDTEREKVAVVFMDGRWVAINGDFTPDEVRDAVEYIKRLRKQKADEKAMAESSPYFVKGGQVFIKDAVIQKVQLSRTETDPRKGYAINVGIGPEIKTSVKLSPEMEKAISDVVSAELKKNLQPGGTIWSALSR
ncbi:TPA: hypothetical protein N5O45_004473 [Enterobacter kobei]|jgi:hypothetical protein|uniref:hypothetical protein n=1 Tax=Enterobacter TaxID=547 RepID=UPI000E41F8D7|nr:MULTISPECIES: hypothetical protein [Enterobacter]EKS9204690.1 hypothetical protein [Enterobacter cloacae]HDR2781324.1 hypothetical protein [Enterobacter sichuanensis]EKV5785835.1 hypothetical protein [Enterobacter cloacae]MBT1950746.1 hypothetical protein [Enterobacter kobei]MCE1358733.1 hypothetical protein [Enterobacter kobei]